MNVNVREGFARLARVTAITYWAGWGIGISFSVIGNVRSGYAVTSELKDAAGYLFMAAVFYAALWAAFRAIRWIALGFMEKAA